MQENILTCDLCRAEGKAERKAGHARRVDAVATLVLVNGRPVDKSPHVDVCKKHKRRIERLFLPPGQVHRFPSGKRVGRPPAEERKKTVRSPADVEKRAEMWQGREALAMSIMRGLKSDSIHIGELVKGLKIHRTGARHVVNSLIKQGYVKPVGPFGRWRRYAVVVDGE